MPLVRVWLRPRQTRHFRKAILEAIYGAMRSAFDVPDEDRFMVMSELDKADFSYSKSYFGISRSDDLIMIQISANNTRTGRKEKGILSPGRRQPGR